MIPNQPLRRNYFLLFNKRKMTTASAKIVIAISPQFTRSQEKVRSAASIGFVPPPGSRFLRRLAQFGAHLHQLQRNTRCPPGEAFRRAASTPGASVAHRLLSSVLAINAQGRRSSEVGHLAAATYGAAYPPGLGVQMSTNRAACQVVWEPGGGSGQRAD